MPPTVVLEPSLRRSTAQKTLFLACVAVVVFFIPYLVPVSPSISLSYIVGFSNAAATILFVTGIAMFAVFTRGEIASVEAGDSELPVYAVVISSAIILLLCLAHVNASMHGRVGHTELEYDLNRQQMLAAGFRPYVDYEFLYGPILLYPGFLVARLLHVSQMAGYYASWVLEWLIGNVFMWSVVRGIDVPMRYRLSLYAGLCFYQSFAIPTSGVSYTPFRAYSAVFSIFAAYTVWKRTNNAWMTAIASILATTFAMLISMEQGLGVAAGLGGYLLLLSWSSRSAFPRKAVALFAMGCTLCIGTAVRAHLLSGVLSYASGGLKFPLLPSGATCVVLFVYAVAGTVLYRHIRFGRLDTAAVPLAIGGFAMLPSALGRCDLGHMMSATPAVIVGVAAMSAMPSLRKWWFTLFFLLIYAIPAVTGLRGTPEGHWLKRILFHADRAVPHQNEDAVGTGREAPGEPPCDQRYYSPFYLPWLVRFDVKCIDTGYYLGQWNISTAKDIDRKIEEMRTRPAEPLLLTSGPLEKQFITNDYESDTAHLYSLEGAYIVPRAKNPPFTFEKIVTYVRGHYVPGPIINQGRMQIWYPIATTVQRGATAADSREPAMLFRPRSPV